MGEAQKVVILTGPNGAGKTTFAWEFLPNEANCPVFVNAGELPRLLEEGGNP